MMGVNNLKEAIVAAASIANALDNSLQDGKIDITDAPVFFSALMKIGPAIKDADQIPGELKDLSNEERAEVIDLVKSELTLSNEKTEKVIGHALCILSDIHQIVLLLKKDQSQAV